MKRERIDKNMALAVIDKILLPLAADLGARRLVDPFLTEYDAESNTLEFGLGYKRHGDKRHRTRVKLRGTHIRDGEKTEGKTTIVELDHRIGWSRLHDNRLVENLETVTESIMSYEEQFNKLRSLSSVDVLSELTVSAQGEFAGIGGSVTQHTSVSAHTEIETEKFSHTKREKKIDDSVTIAYPVGEIWLIERPVITLQASKPVKQWGIWDVAEIVLNLYDWAGNYGVMPGGHHSNVLTFNGLSDVLAFVNRELVLTYPWSEKYRPGNAVKRGITWLKNEKNRNVGPVEWDQVRINENVAALQPSAISAEDANLS